MITEEEMDLSGLRYSLMKLNKSNPRGKFEITKDLIERVKRKGFRVENLLLPLCTDENCVLAVDFCQKIISNFYKNTYTEFDYRFFINVQYPIKTIIMKVETNSYSMQLPINITPDMDIGFIRGYVKREIVQSFVEHFIKEL